MDLSNSFSLEEAASTMHPEEVEKIRAKLGRSDIRLSLSYCDDHDHVSIEVYKIIADGIVKGHYRRRVDETGPNSRAGVSGRVVLSETPASH